MAPGGITTTDRPRFAPPFCWRRCGVKGVAPTLLRAPDISLFCSPSVPVGISPGLYGGDRYYAPVA